MLTVCFNHKKDDLHIAVMDNLIEKFPQISSMHYVINQKVNDSIADQDAIHYSGDTHLEESLDHVTFDIGPKSFFQTNTYQAEVMYQQVARMAQLSAEDNVYDLYTGIGSIGLYLAKDAGHIVGIEAIPEAIEDAKINMEKNGITNCTFYAGDVKEILSPAFWDKHGRPDVLITDPPRAGMHADVVEMLLTLESPRIVYVSCNPATQARDLKLLSEKYEITELQPIDMFPHTHHIENIALLKLK
jgi:23S rRNA (uracil1939-C5)-methyltransferase